MDSVADLYFGGLGLKYLLNEWLLWFEVFLEGCGCWWWFCWILHVDAGIMPYGGGYSSLLICSYLITTYHFCRAADFR